MAMKPKQMVHRSSKEAEGMALTMQATPQCNDAEEHAHKGSKSSDPWLPAVTARAHSSEGAGSKGEAAGAKASAGDIGLKMEAEVGATVSIMPMADATVMVIEVGWTRKRLLALHTQPQVAMVAGGGAGAQGGCEVANSGTGESCIGAVTEMEPSTLV